MRPESQSIILQTRKVNQMTARRSEKGSKRPPVEVRAAVARLRELYAQGQEIADKCERGKWGDIAEQASLHGIHPETARSLRKFAERYTEKQLDALCKQAERYGRALGPSHIYKFLTIRKIAERGKFQRRAITEGWSLSKIEAELRRFHGKRGHVGRKPKMPVTLDDACVQLESMAQTWLRWLNALEAQPADETTDPLERIKLSDLPRGIRADLKRLLPILQQIQAQANRRLG